MRVVFWNIRAGGGVRAAAITRQIAAWEADTVALAPDGPNVVRARQWLAEGLELLARD